MKRTVCFLAACLFLCLVPIGCGKQASNTAVYQGIDVVSPEWVVSLSVEPRF